MAKSQSTIYVSSEDDFSPRREKSKHYLDRIFDDLSSDDDTQQASYSPFKSTKRASKAHSEALQGFRKTAKSSKSEDFLVKTVVIMPNGLDEDKELSNPVVPDEKLACQNHLEGIRFKMSWSFREINEFVASFFKERGRKLLLCANDDPMGGVVYDFAKKSKKSGWSDSILIFVLRFPLDLAEYESWLNGDDASRRNSDSEPSSSNILLPDDSIDEYPPNQLMLGVGSSRFLEIIRRCLTQKSLRRRLLQNTRFWWVLILSILGSECW
ncbi:hypothetical protein ACEPAF_7592 [Sanghuangporus sanghuang]